MKTKPKITKNSVGLIGLGILLLAIILLITALSIQYGFEVIIGWFISSQALLAYLVIFIFILILIPIWLLHRINKR